MTIIHEERLSDSPYVESITRGWTANAGSTIRPAEYHWHMVFVRVQGHMLPLAVGPLTSSGLASWGAEAEILWIKFKLGVFMPHWPIRKLLDAETPMPDAAFNAFWLNSATWEFPDYENADTFVDRLVRDASLLCDPVVSAVLQDCLPESPSRTVRHRFLRATGLTQTTIRQMQRAQQAAALLEHGVSILDTVGELGYFDQPHLTRSLKRFVGNTPAQMLRVSAP